MKSYSSRTSKLKCVAGFRKKIDQTTEAIEELERQEYVSNLKKLDFDATRRDQLEIRQRKLESEYESAAKKMDMLLCDLQAAYQLVKLSQSIVKAMSSLDVEFSP